MLSYLGSSPEPIRAVLEGFAFSQLEGLDAYVIGGFHLRLA